MNLDKLDAAIAYIEAHPDQHDQDVWFRRDDGGCGTSACLAGWIAVLDGWKPTQWLPEYGGESTSLAEKDGRVESVDTVAYEVLGVDRGEGFTWEPFEWEVGQMFEAGNSLREIKWMRDDIAEQIAAGES